MKKALLLFTSLLFMAACMHRFHLVRKLGLHYQNTVINIPAIWNTKSQSQILSWARQLDLWWTFRFLNICISNRP